MHGATIKIVMPNRQNLTTSSLLKTNAAMQQYGSTRRVKLYQQQD